MNKKLPTKFNGRNLAMALTIVGVLLLATYGIALAFTQSNFISFTLEGCRNDGTITLPNGSGQFVCPDAAYTTGNLGKGWNELDLVPHRLTTRAGNQGGVTTNYDVYIAADYQTSGKTGYDVISVPVVNTAKSDASCSVTAGPQSTQGSASQPFGGGTDVVIYRDLTIHQNPGTTCVFDYYQRLALGSHLYPGSSLQSYLFTQSGLSGSKKTISIPVNQILPQSLSKDMTATQGTDHIWDITKGSTPATLTFANTCDVSQPTSQSVQIKVSWTKEAANPNGPITVITNVYATNPSARTITTNVTDVIYSGTTALDTSPTVTVEVPANTANLLVLTHTFDAPSGTTNLNDIATATYTDLVTGIPVPGNTTATASATVQLSGSELNASAIINDVENMTGSGLKFSADSFTPAIGSFDNSYIAGTQTVGPVSWTSTSQSGSGSVTFDKTVYVAGPSQTSGSLSDTATLTGSDGFSANASASVNVSADARVSLTINKTVAPALTSGSQTFTFHVFNSSNVEVATPTITFSAGDTSKSVTISNLAPGSYSVSEDPVASWVTDSTKSVTINLPTCSGSVSFTNKHVFSPSISTTPNPTSAIVGAILNDSATLSGGYNPTGNIVFNLYGPSDTTCAGPALYNQTVTVSGAGASTSPGFTTAAVGTYRWTASYSGDTYNNAASSGCQAEQVTVNKATPTLITNASGPVIVGQAIHDVATLGGGYTPTGSITFDVFAPGDTTCATPTNVPPAQTVSGAGNYTSGDYTTSAVGFYRWIAHYSGDANNNAVNTACNDANEASTVNKASPSFTTQASPTSGTVGQALTVGDAATFSGGYNPSGSVVFTLYSDNQCTVAAGVSGSGSISGSSASFSTSWTPSATGTFYWIASYIGDSNNNGFTTKCGDANEQIVIGEASPSIDTTASPDSGTVGQALTVGDTATLSGGDNPTGSITFTLYSDNKCTVSTGITGTGTISGGSATFSTSWTPLAAGTYYWQASYPGDANNNPVTEPCGASDEKVVIGKVSPAIATSATNATGASTSVSDSATLSGGYNPTGSITFKLYGPSATADCSNLVFTSSQVAVNGNGTYGPVSFSPTSVGSYYWIASYSGDANNNPASTACGDTGETSTVSPGLAQVIKTVNGSAPSGTQAFTFELRQGASVSADGTILEQIDANASNGGVINFTTQLVPGQHYQMCEIVLPGWNTTLGPNLFVPNSIIPPSLPNPNVNNMTVCTDFVAQGGQTTTFTVDNTPPPGGRALTIGFWKNWASCAASNGKQQPILDQTLAIATSSTSNPPAGLVVSAQNAGSGWPSFAATYYLILQGDPNNPNVAPSCTAAVNLLNKTKIDGSKKMASDPAFNLAAQLVGAELNFFAGAGKNGTVVNDVNQAVLILGKYQFNGLTHTTISKADITVMNNLATALDNYNNDQ